MDNLKIANEILMQLGGNRFIAMTGAKNFGAVKNTLRMQIGKNRSKANRLWITLEPSDTYTMRFFKYTAPRYNSKTGLFTEEKIVDIETVPRVYAEDMQRIFTRVTGMETRL